MDNNPDYWRVQHSRERLSQILAQLIRRRPFWGRLAMLLKPVFTLRVPTFAVDGVHLLVNPGYADSLADSEYLFMLSHEAGHCALHHPFRAKALLRFYPPRLINVAMDYLVNHMLVKDQVIARNVLQEKLHGFYDPVYSPEDWDLEALCKELASQKGKDTEPSPNKDPDSPCRDGGDDEYDQEEEDALSGAGEEDDERDARDAEDGDTGDTGESLPHDEDADGEGDAEDGDAGDGDAGDGDGRGDAGDGDAEESGSEEPEHGPGKGRLPSRERCEREQGDALDCVFDPGEWATGTREQIEAICREAASKWKYAPENTARMVQQLGIGTVPGHMQKVIEDMNGVRRTTDWKAALRMWVFQQTQSDFSWKRPNKRYQPEYTGGAVLPSMSSQEAGAIVLCVDTSGSVDDSLFRTFLGEIGGLMREFPGITWRYYQCDTDLVYIGEFQGEDQIPDPHRFGFGGTDFSPVFREVEAEGWTDVIGLIYFTDLQGRTDRDCVPDYPVLWAHNADPRYDRHRLTQPFGDYLRVEEDADE